MPKTILFHGSDHIIKNPSYKLGKENNDYGKGFYCTLIPNLAKEWACKGDTNGFVNEYEFDVKGLKVLNLLDGKHTVLNWIALLLKHRVFTIQDEIAKDAKDYIIKHFGIDTKEHDVIIGYRADDSYFSYAQSFISNSLSLNSLSKALLLGKLGEQTALISPKAFEHIKYIGSEPVKKQIYYEQFKQRDTTARETYQKEIRNKKSHKNDIFVMDIIREGITSDDPRIQRIILK